MPPSYTHSGEIMVQIEKVNSFALSRSIEPVIQFNIEMSFIENKEFPLSFYGELHSEDNMFLSTLIEIGHKDKSFELKGKFKDVKYKERIYRIKLITYLSRKMLDYIETMRDKNPKGDVKFNLKLYGKFLESNITISPIDKIISPPLRDLIPKLGGAQQWANRYLLFFGEKLPDSPPTNESTLISAKFDGTVITLHEHELKKEITIPASDWIHDYAPNFNMGKYLVAEIPIIEQLKIDDEFSKRISKAIEALLKMQKNIISGDWTEVMEGSRHVIELLRNEPLIKQILEDDGYTDVVSKEIYESLKNLFKFSSKFHHKLDLDKKIKREFVPKKEDAYLIYFTTAGLVNLLTRKLKRKEDISK